MGTILKIEHLSKVFRVPVLQDIHLNIESGELLGIVGASGSGKTTFLQLLIGFIEPSQGKILVHHNGYMSIEQAESTIKHHVGFSAQEPSFYPQLTVEENLDFFGSMYGLSLLAQQKNADVLLKLLELNGFRKVKGKNLSGGMRKRLDIACALIHNPKILLLDEPTADLDPHLRTHLWQVIKRINNGGTTIILTSHILEEVEQVCDRVALLKDGKINQINTPKQLIQGLKHRAVIKLETVYGKYDAIIKNLEPYIKKVERKDYEIILHIDNVHEAIKLIPNIVEQSNDIITYLDVKRPTLNHVFENMLK